MFVANPRLKNKVKEWHAKGCPSQEAFNWSKSRENWIKNIHHQKVFIEKLPPALDRSTVRKFCESTGTSIQQKFLTVMIWGYGDLGYGSYRVSKMFKSTNFNENLETSFELGHTNRAIESYAFLSKNRILQLGPAYATKWLSFITPRSSPAPIFDKFISLWITRFASSSFKGVNTSSENWNTKTYKKYYEWVYRNCGELGLQADDLEYVIFEDSLGMFNSGSKWSKL